MKPSEQAITRLSRHDRLDQVRMNPEGRRMTTASPRRTEWVADALIRANDDLGHAFGYIGRGISAVARPGKISPLAPEWRLP